MPLCSPAKQHHARAFLLLGAACFYAACGLGEQGIADVAGDSIPARPTYEAHAKPILQFYCASCHTYALKPGESYLKDQEDECDDDKLDYSGYDGSVTCFQGVVETVFDESSMPPGAAPRIRPREQVILRRWQQAGFPR